MGKETVTITSKVVTYEYEVPNPAIEKYIWIVYEQEIFKAIYYESVGWSLVGSFMVINDSEFRKGTITWIYNKDLCNFIVQTRKHQINQIL